MLEQAGEKPDAAPSGSVKLSNGAAGREKVVSFCVAGIMRLPPCAGKSPVTSEVPSTAAGDAAQGPDHSVPPSSAPFPAGYSKPSLMPSGLVKADGLRLAVLGSGTGGRGPTLAGIFAGTSRTLAHLNRQEPAEKGRRFGRFADARPRAGQFLRGARRSRGRVLGFQRLPHPSERHHPHPLRLLARRLAERGMFDESPFVWGASSGARCIRRACSRRTIMAETIILAATACGSSAQGSKAAMSSGRPTTSATTS